MLINTNLKIDSCFSKNVSSNGKRKWKCAIAWWYRVFYLILSKVNSCSSEKLFIWSIYLYVQLQMSNFYSLSNFYETLRVTLVWLVLVLVSENSIHNHKTGRRRLMLQVYLKPKNMFECLMIFWLQLFVDIFYVHSCLFFITSKYS